MYVIVASVEVKPEYRQEFIKAALQNCHDSNLNEPGTKRFELAQDESNPNLFYFNEAYQDKEAFNAHTNGPYYQAFISAASGYYAQKPRWLERGMLISQHE